MDDPRPLSATAGAQASANRANGALSMGLYATAEQVTTELAGLEGLSLPSGEQLERLIEAGERAVDGRLGPLEVDPVYGRKLPLVVDLVTGEVSLDPELTTPAQRAAVVRAVALAVGHISMQDSEQLLGVDDFIPEQVRPLRGRGLPALLDAELAGFGLIARSGCCLPDPPVIVPDDGIV